GTLGLANTTFGDSDFAWVGIVVGYFSETGIVGAYILVVALCAVLLAVASLVTIRMNRPVASKPVAPEAPAAEAA
ncbi:MAG TPA: hypothetical protein VHX44_17100, partial [Planctomycetota bacterium]|nr:hypothetical protein [Planctomycetota bacterium]